MKKTISRGRKKVVIALTGLMVLVGVSGDFSPKKYSYATSEQMSELEDEKKKTEQQLKDANNKVNQLENTQTGLKQDLTSYSSKLDSVKQNINKIYQDIEAKEAEIADTKAQLDAAQKREEEQYEAMKVRIKYMYENGNDNAFEALFKANSFQDFLNRAEYVKAMMQYDRDMLNSFTETKENIAKAKEKLESEQKELEAAQDKAQSEETKLADLITSTQDGIEKYAKDIKAAEERAKAYERKLEEQENQIENLKALIAQQKALVNGEIKVGKFKYHAISDLARNSSNLQVLSAIIECEACIEPYEGKIAVGSVIMNRVKSDKFPNTMLEVIHQKSQFSPVGSGRFAIVLARGACSNCVQAAQEVLNGANNIDAHFFRMNNGMIDGTIIGNHVFY